MITRRQLLTTSAVAAGAAVLSRASAVAQQTSPAAAGYPNSAGGGKRQPAWMRAPHPEPGEPGKHYKPVVTLNGSTMPWKLVDGVKVFHMTCDEVWHEFVPKT